MINAPLLRKVMEHIETLPEQGPEVWRQSVWREKTDCETAMCFAGWACQLSGVTWRGSASDTIMLENGDYTDAMDKAQELLGLDDDQAEDLFDPFNALEDLQEMVDGLCELADEEL